MIGPQSASAVSRVGSIVDHTVFAIVHSPADYFSPFSLCIPPTALCYYAEGWTHVLSFSVPDHSQFEQKNTYSTMKVCFDFSFTLKQFIIVRVLLREPRLTEYYSSRPAQPLRPRQFDSPGACCSFNIPEFSPQLLDALFHFGCDQMWSQCLPTWSTFIHANADQF